jgi:hypothetical protein
MMILGPKSFTVLGIDDRNTLVLYNDHGADMCRMGLVDVNAFSLENDLGGEGSQVGEWARIPVTRIVATHDNLFRL